MSVFKLAAERLTELPEHHRAEASAGWWADRDLPGESPLSAVEAPFVFEFDVSRHRDEITIEGEMTGQVGLECGRCGKRYSHALRDSFRLVLSAAKARVPDDPEGLRGLTENGVCLGEDLEVGLFKGPQLRFDDYFGELIALAMPLQPLCRSDCPGICSHCGVDLAQMQCDCVDERIESPFAVLAKLKDKGD
jgi:uncharacterized protein